MISAYQAYAKGESPVSIKHGIDQYNAESVSDRKALSLMQSRQEYDSARQKVIQIMREMPVEKLTERLPAPWGGMCTVASVVKIFVSHELEHAEHIEESIKSSIGSA